MSLFSRRNAPLPWRGLPPLSAILPVLGLAISTLAAGPVHAQATISVDGGLDSHYRSDQWVPLRVQLTNQGTPARVEVRARFQQGAEESDEYRLPTRDLVSGANQTHTLYVKAPTSYASQAVQVELMREGRLLNRVRVPLNLVAEGDWLVLGIGNSDSTLKLLTTLQLPAQQNSPMTRPWATRSGPARVQVAVQSPNEVTDRWQGLMAADMVVLGDVSERDLTPEQQTALRQYVAAGGSLVVTGGVNWNRLTTPFFADLLPVRVTGGRTSSDASALNGLGKRQGPVGSQFGYCAATLKPGTKVLAGSKAVPLVVVGSKGAGRVLFTSFDPSLPPFRAWEGATELWKSLMTQPHQASLVPMLSSAERTSSEYDAYMGSSIRGGGGLAEAPYAISQLDIPAFYVVALFLLAYIIVLVPVNYFFLKARDKKEYAWLTTPAIVAVFSIGAYMIGYGFKGGRTLLVRVGVMEARAGQDAAPSLSYAGLFSPRKTGYEVQLAPGDATNGETASALLSEPRTDRATPGMLVLEDETQQIRDFAVDMWAMRVLKTESVVSLGGGFTAQLSRQSKGFSGSVRNNTPFALADCRILTRDQLIPAGDLAAGGTLTFKPDRNSPASGGGILPTALLDEVQGKSEEARVKRALLTPLCSAGYVNIPGWRSPDDPLLIGWLKAPLSRFQVNGGAPREQSATLVVVHLGKPSASPG